MKRALALYFTVAAVVAGPYARAVEGLPPTRPASGLTLPALAADIRQMDVRSANLQERFASLTGLPFHRRNDGTVITYVYGPALLSDGVVLRELSIRTVAGGDRHSPVLTATLARDTCIDARKIAQLSSSQLMVHSALYKNGWYFVTDRDRLFRIGFAMGSGTTSGTPCVTALSLQPNDQAIH